MTDFDARHLLTPGNVLVLTVERDLVGSFGPPLAVLRDPGDITRWPVLEPGTSGRALRVERLAMANCLLVQMLTGQHAGLVVRVPMDGLSGAALSAWERAPGWPAAPERPPADPGREERAAGWMVTGQSPAEWAARHSHDILAFSFHEYRYRDPALDAWVWDLGQILFNRRAVEEARRRFLTGDEIAYAELRETEEF